jgi:hypothetical protein
MQTSLIISKIEETKFKLAPLFGVSQEETRKFQNPIIVRGLGENDYPGNNIPSYGYDFLRNMFYVKKDYESHKDFLDPFIYSTSQYLHSQINPEMRKYEIDCFFLKKEVNYYFELKDLVGAYPDIIFRNTKDLSESYLALYMQYHKKHVRVFEEYGSEFLPELARMSLEEFSKSNLVKILRKENGKR